MYEGESSLMALRDKLVGWSITGVSGVRFHLRELLGEGGQGWVYKANYDEPDGIWVVVKMLRPDSITHDALLRFQREAEVLRFIGAQPTPSPNVVRFYDHGVTSLRSSGAPDAETVDLPFTVLEFVDGVTLAELLNGPPPQALAVARARRILRQVVRALETVHAHRVVHRDLKPSNILLTQQAGQEVAKVTDFGLVKLVDLRLTQTAAIAGASLGYAPPEQYEHGNERVSERTDVFSLGAIMYETLAGRSAFPFGNGENPLRVITRILAGPRPSLRDAMTTMAPELRDQPALIDLLDVEFGQALQPDPAKRQASCRALWDAVEPLLRAAEERLPPPEPGMRKSMTSDVGQAGAVPSMRRYSPEISTPGAEPRSFVATGNARRPALRVLAGVTRGMALRSALFGADGSMIALGSGGLYRFAERAWSCLPPISGVADGALRGMSRTPDGRILLFGDNGFVGTLQHTGKVEVWPTCASDLRVNAAAMLNSDTAILVGERMSRQAGVIALLPRSRPDRALLMEWPAPLRAVAPLNSTSFLAVGEAGVIVNVTQYTQTPVPWARSGHLYAVAARGDGTAALVGSGGHALALSNTLQPTLERVETTKDLHAVAFDVAGEPWAAGAAGRVLRHAGDLWQRVLPDVDITSKFIAIGATSEGIIALADDGLVVEAATEVTR